MTDVYILVPAVLGACIATGLVFVGMWYAVRHAPTIPTPRRFWLPRLTSRKPDLPQAARQPRDRLKALMFGWEFPPFNSGGLGVACLGIVRALSRANTDVTFVLPRAMPVTTPYARILSANIEAPTIAVNSGVIPYSEGGSYARNADGSPVYGNDLVEQVARYAQAAAEIAAREPHDVIYAHDWLSFEAGRAAKRVSGKPLVAHIHATEFDRTGGGINAAIYAIERAGFHAADRIIAVSELTKRMVVRHYGVPPEKIAVVHNGIDEATAPSGTADTSTLRALKDTGNKLVLFLGRITLQKGPDYFVRAAARVLAADPKVYFVLAGSGDMEQQVMHQAAALGIADRVLFPGFLRGNDQFQAFALADLFIMPSVSEPFGIAAIEAMHVGTPVIVSKQSGAAEAVSHALKVDFWDTDELANQIMAVLALPAIADVLAENAKHESAHLTWDRAASRIRDVIDPLVSPAIAPV